MLRGVQDFGVKKRERDRRYLATWNELDECGNFTKTSTFNVIGVQNCSMNAAVQIFSGEDLRIRGRADLDHPEIHRGGTQRSPFVFRHFVLSGNGKMVLINLKLSGAFVGKAIDSQRGASAKQTCRKCETYCQQTTGRICNCNQCVSTFRFIPISFICGDIHSLLFSLVVLLRWL